MSISKKYHRADNYLGLQRLVSYSTRWGERTVIIGTYVDSNIERKLWIYKTAATPILTDAVETKPNIYSSKQLLRKIKVNCELYIAKLFETESEIII